MDHPLSYVIQPHCACHPRPIGARPGQCDNCGAPTWSIPEDEVVGRLRPGTRTVCNHCISKLPWPEPGQISWTRDVVQALARCN